MVVLCGSSTGGNLLLAASQDSRLLQKVTGVAAIYPPIDLAEDGEAKMARRPDPTVADFIGDTYASISRLYFDPARSPSMTDVRVSPAYFAERKALPSQILLIGAEHDMFCHEDETMADKLAEMAGGVKAGTATGWKAWGVQWSKIKGQPHAFDAFPAKTPVMEASRLAAVDTMFSVVSEWLIDVFTAGASK
jgi:acetyl esterase/lipase